MYSVNNAVTEYVFVVETITLCLVELNVARV